MAKIENKNILLGVTAGIAAYKAAELARLLVKNGANVRVVMTPSAKEFVGPLTFQAITGHACRDSLFDPAHEAAMGHIELARWADVILVAPASADFIAKLHAGMADTLLHTLCLASTADIYIAPAMNQQMWANKATQKNILGLERRGTMILGPAEGEQACGDTGFGRMLEPSEIVSQLIPGSRINTSKTPPRNNLPLSGKTVVITAGPTREAVDPVRFISNRSSGKMGYALAESALNLGAEVILVSGPVNIKSLEGITLKNIETADDMLKNVMKHINKADIFIACAAVADYRPSKSKSHKIKKDQESLSIKLTRNPDILATVSALDNRPFCVGFAAETQNLEEYARSKMQRKNLDMIAANLVGKNMGFDTEENALQVYWSNGKKHFPQQNKKQLADQLLSLITERFNAQA